MIPYPGGYINWYWCIAWVSLFEEMVLSKVIACGNLPRREAISCIKILRNDKKPVLFHINISYLLNTFVN